MWFYQLSNGKCELCGSRSKVYKINTHWKTTIYRCELCLKAIKQYCKNIIAVEIKNKKLPSGYILHEEALKVDTA
jgi:excinuclease UvrABC ATPase subunit